MAQMKRKDGRSFFVRQKSQSTPLPGLPDPQANPFLKRGEKRPAAKLPTLRGRQKKSGFRSLILKKYIFLKIACPRPMCIAHRGVGNAHFRPFQRGGRSVVAPLHLLV